MCTAISIPTNRLSDNKVIKVVEFKAVDPVISFSEKTNGDVDVIIDNRKGFDYIYEIKWSEIYK